MKMFYLLEIRSFQSTSLICTGFVIIGFPHGLPLAEAIVANNFSAKIKIIVEFA
jgi:hypothetical protein